MMAEVLHLQLRALRALCVGIVRTIDALEVTVAATAEAQTAPPPPPAPVEPEDGDEEGTCLHPEEFRMRLPVMGGRRFKCQKCNEDFTE